MVGLVRKRLRAAGLDDAQSFLRYVLLTKLSFRITFLPISITCKRAHSVKDSDEQKSAVVV